MGPLGKLGLAASVSALVATVACRDGTAPVAPRDLMIMAGDSQETSLGEALPSPLRVRVIGADGQPLRGATVRWSVTRGQATVEPAQSNTDAYGDAETRVTVGGIVGAGSVSARVLDVPPVGFALEATDPCLWRPQLAVLTPGEVAGRLQPLDCEQGERQYTDFYRFAFSSQQALRFRLKAENFSPLLSFYVLQFGTYWGQGGLYSGDREVAFTAILAPGAHLIAPGSFTPNTTGSYVLSVGPASPSADACETVVVGRGVTTAQALVSTDCTRTVIGRYHEDHFMVALETGEEVTITQSSTSFVPRLRLHLAGGALVSEAVGSADGTATIRFTSSETLWYVIDAASELSEQSGAYTLSVSDPFPGLGSAAASSDVRRLGLLADLSRFDRGAIAEVLRLRRP
jgi:hypothetical protein